MLNDFCINRQNTAQSKLPRNTMGTPAILLVLDLASHFLSLSLSLSSVVRVGTGTGTGTHTQTHTRMLAF